jgi:hypothetical protein
VFETFFAFVTHTHTHQVDEFRRNPSSVRVFDFLVGVALKMLKFKVAPKKVAAAMRSQVATDDKAAS